MVDSRRIYLSPPHLTGSEIGFLHEAVESNWIAPVGPQIEAFEREMARTVGVAHAVALGSGTAGLHLALLNLGISEGDSVICPTLTFVASANAIRYCGAEPVFVDSCAETWNIDPALLEEALERCRQQGKPAAAVMAVDLYGQCADYAAIEETCASHGVPLLEDAAEALGASYHGRPAGSFGHGAVFSFNGNKIITTSGGGMLVSDSADFVEKARRLATQARDPAPHYQHSEVGYNYRLSNLLAAVGRGQLSALPSRVEKRRKIFSTYVELLGDLAGLVFQPEDEAGRSTRWLTCLTIDEDEFGADREAIRLALEAENIESRPLWKPMHLQPLYRGYPIVRGSQAANLFRRGLCLPSGTSLTRADQERIAGVIRACHRKSRA